MFQNSYFHVQRQQSSPMASGPEPMVMGSPSSPNMPHPQSHSAYLPGYLLGDPPSGVSSPSHNRLWSAGTASSGSPAAKVSGSNQSINSPFGHGGLSKSLLDAKPELSSSLRGSGKGKSAGPPIPIQGLLESSFSNKSIHGTPSDSKPPRLGAIFSTPNAGRPRDSVYHLSQSTPAVNKPHSVLSVNSTSVHTEQLSPPQVDPFYTQGDSLTSDDVLDETWITIFGFPKGAASYVHAQFSQYGVIVKHEISNDGNWMHVHYQTHMQARKALSKNGKIIGNNIMVGVRQCIDKKVMGITPPANRSSRQETGHASLYDSFSSPPSTIGEQLGTPKLGTPIRPLTAAYKASAAERQVIPDNNVLQKQDGIVSKAMEYLFGW